MKRKTGVWLIYLGLLLVLGLLKPNLGQPKEPGEGKFSGQREQLITDLGLSPDVAKAFLAVGGKWDQIRKDITVKIKKNEADLETALAAPQPDEGKINTLVSTLVIDHDQLFGTFMAQRQDEMALLTPVQRGKFLLALKKWHEQQMR
jgi:hypothetical protein